MSMTAATLIECPECGGTNFYLLDGRHVCRRCNRESRDHGIETTLDDESFGAFGSGAKTHRSRYPSKQWLMAQFQGNTDLGINRKVSLQYLNRMRSQAVFYSKLDFKQIITPPTASPGRSVHV